MGNEELMRLLTRTTMLARRIQHGEGGARGEFGGGFPQDAGGAPRGHGDGKHGPHGPRGHGPCGGHGHRPGPPGPHGPHQRRGQGRVLAMLALKEGQSQKDLAYVLGIRPQSLSEIIGKLEDESLVERRKSPDDGRVMNVYLTDKGRERAAQAAENRKRNAENVFASLSDAEKEQLATILTKLATSLEDE